MQDLLAFDLHVLSGVLAFILGQDQTHNFLSRLELNQRPDG